MVDSKAIDDTKSIEKSKKEDSKMAEKVAKVGVKKAKGYLYFIDKQGDVSRAKMARGGKKKKAKAKKKKR